ncbi:trypsin-like peptidase domain-containing protein [Paenibacillus profundus]|uniref:Trypsin-like peptidase domain-containing protein n=1 Tax=Paenibacillus profundus TaxID=1173085 RepID=A0ABS8YMP2_9BACL|nr:trypsin-like peptidase domain-containing protein [Paenibacillus profundus]MCE5172454.1 trypsin-like peptidase domain-containing protein [Paenibacillus profundus]
MSFFDDDFFSPKVSRRIKRKWHGQTEAPGWKQKKLRRNSGRKWSTVQVAVVSSVISALLAVVLYSWLVGAGTASQQPVAVAGGENAYDPYERIVQAAEKVSPAVVSIVNQQKSIMDDSEAVKDTNLGSGVIFSQENGKAYVLTNEHVVQGADKLEVVLANGQRKNAELIGKDRVMDIAVIRMDDAGVTAVAEIGDSKKLRRGETVIAIGNPLGFGDSLTAGIISYTNRVIPVSLNQDGIYDWEQMVIQTDAAINEGNSGGALVNLNGQVIGINTMKIATTGVEGLGFAIPTNEVMWVVDQITQYGKVVRPYLGVYTVDLNNPYAPITQEQREDLQLPLEVTAGVIVLEATGPAKKAGMQLNDVIVRFDNEPIGTTLDLRKYLYEKKKIGESLDVKFYRDGKLMTTSVELSDKPE